MLACSPIHNYIIALIGRINKGIIRILATIYLTFAASTSLAIMSNEISHIISNTEREYKIPKGLLQAIIQTESSSKPYTVNIGGKGHYTQDFKEALFVIQKALSKGIKNIDIGLAQINYRCHHHHFGSVAAMLRPESNIDYAAKLLSGLKGKHGSWHTAVRYYHSKNKKHHNKYSRKVVMLWLEGGTHVD